MTPTFSTVINFSMLGLMRRLHRLQLQSQLHAESSASGVVYSIFKTHERKTGVRNFCPHSLRSISNDKISETVDKANAEAKEAIKELGMPVLNLKRQEFGTNHNKDSDIDDGEQSDHDVEQNSTVINDVVREVCMEDPEDIKSDIQTLSNAISDGVRERLCSLQSTISEPSTTQNQCGNYTKHSPFLKLRDNTFIRKTTAVWLLQEGERVSSDRLFRVRGKQPFSMEIEPTLSEKFTTGKDTRHISDKVEVGDMCSFKKKKTFRLERFFNSAAI